MHATRTARLLAALSWWPVASYADSTTLSLPFADSGSWSFAGTGPHEGWADRRDLFVLHHPWAESRADTHGTVSREVEVPASWSRPIRLHFYMADDYDGQYRRLEEGEWLGQCNFIGHRFKQVLVNDAVIWEQDVADAEGTGVPTRFSLTLPERIGPGDRFRLAFRLVDKIAGAERRPDDFRHVGSTDGIKANDPWKFMTHLYVADVTLTDGKTETVPPGQRPSADKVKAHHAGSHSPRSLSPPVRYPVPLTVEGAGVVCCGLPFSPGKLTDPQQITLRDATGRALTLQTDVMNRWPDGSARWVRVDTIVPATSANQPLQLNVDGKVSPTPAQPVTIERNENHRIEITTGDLRAVAGTIGEPLSCRLENGRTVLKDLSSRLEIDGNDVVARVSAINVLTPGPVRGEVELTGNLEAGSTSLGRFVLRLAVFAGQPYVRITWRIFNDQPKTLDISRFELVANLDLEPEATALWHSESMTAGAPVLLRQLKEESFEVLDGADKVLDEGPAAAGWLAVRDKQRSLAVVVRHFREQFPKALEFKDDRLRISLFETSDHQTLYRPTEGEAKRHELWIGLWNDRLPDEEVRDFARYSLRPARLFNAEYVCATGGHGYAAVHDADRFGELDAYMKKTFPNVAAKRFYEYGIRHWGDQRYNKDEDYWHNGYYDRQQGFAAEYIMTGDPRWFDRLEATVRHIIDIDVCHASKEHPDWVGSIHAYNGTNHTTAGPWNAMQRTKGTLAYWRLTGDIDARDAALGVADSAVRAQRAVGAGSVRDHAGVLYCLTAAYDETRESKYLEAAKRVAHDAMKRIDARRGCYSEIHGNVSYRGNVPWMCAQLAEPMYDYYVQSGDLDAANTVVGLAESILTDNRTRDVPGDVYGYSHNPHFNKTSNYHILIAPSVLYAYELTGDRFFLEQARAMYRQTIRENTVNTITNCYWNTPTLLYYLQAHGLSEGKHP